MGELLAEKPAVREMAGRKPIVIPRLSDGQVSARAGKAYDTAQSKIIAKNFTAPPPRNELLGLMALIKSNPSWKDSEGNLDLNRIVKAYSKKNPSSTIAKYYQATGSPDWLITPAGKIGFNRKELQNQVNASLKAAKKAFVDSAVWLYKQPRDGVKSFNAKELADRMPKLMPEMSTELLAQIRGKANRLPMTVAYSYPEFTLKSTKGPQREDFNL